MHTLTSVHTLSLLHLSTINMIFANWEWCHTAKQKFAVVLLAPTENTLQKTSIRSHFTPNVCTHRVTRLSGHHIDITSANKCIQSQNLEIPTTTDTLLRITCGSAHLTELSKCLKHNELLNVSSSTFSKIIKLDGQYCKPLKLWKTVETNNYNRTRDASLQLSINSNTGWHHMLLKTCTILNTMSCACH